MSFFVAQPTFEWLVSMLQTIWSRILSFLKKFWDSHSSGSDAEIVIYFLVKSMGRLFVQTSQNSYKSIELCTLLTSLSSHYNVLLCGWTNFWWIMSMLQSFWSRMISFLKKFRDSHSSCSDKGIVIYFLVKSMGRLFLPKAQNSYNYTKLCTLLTSLSSHHYVLLCGSTNFWVTRVNASISQIKNSISLKEVLRQSTLCLYDRNSYKILSCKVHRN